MPHSRLRARARARDAAKLAAAAAAIVSPSPQLLKKSCYTLAESTEFENDPSVRIVYMTEKGVDLLAADPDFAMIDYANRNGYSWYHVLHKTPPAAMHMSETKICVVHTTEAELASHKKAIPNHKANILAQIGALPRIEYTMDRIVNVITDYLCAHNITDFDIADQVCEIACSRGLYTPNVATTPLLPASPPHHDSDSDDSEQTLVYNHGQETSEVQPNSGIYTDVSGIQYVPAWIISTFNTICTSIEAYGLAILPIPNYESMNFLE